MRSLFAFSATCRRVMVTAASIGVCLFAVGTRDARADIIVGLPGVLEESPGEFRWFYEVSLGEDQEIRPGAIFSIYDFAGYILGSELADPEPPTAPADWKFVLTTFTPLAFCPAGPPCASLTDPNPPNDPGIPDLTWEYIGTATIESSNVGSDTFLGVFSAASNYGEDTAVDAWFAGLAYSEDQPGGDTEPLVFNSELDTEVPGVPEPGSMLLLATGLFGAAAMIRRRQAAQL